MNLMFTSNLSYNKQYSSGIYHYTKANNQSRLGLPTIIRQNSISNLKNLKNLKHKVSKQPKLSNNTTQNNSLIPCDELFREIELDDSNIDNTKISNEASQCWYPLSTKRW